MVKAKGQPEVVVLPIHFEDRSGTEFERLCFAYLLRAFEWNSIDVSLSPPPGRAARPLRTGGGARLGAQERRR
jgi:hypothetical protein